MRFGIPQAVVAIWIALRVLYHLKNNGNPSEDRFDWKYEAYRGAIIVALLWWGGFFTE
jgi:hypothetical protein